MSTTDLDRRSFLVGAAAAIAQTGAQASPQAEGPAVRRSYDLCRNWSFIPHGDDSALQPGFDDSKSERVTVPHTNIRLPWHSFDDRAYEFVSIYRRHFRAPAGWREKRVFADFDGAMTAATVAINGHAFPEYQGGYTPF